jgi:hypothetical protein
VLTEELLCESDIEFAAIGQRSGRRARREGARRVAFFLSP